MLLAGNDGAAWIPAAERVAQVLDVPLDAYRFGADLESDGLSEAHGIGTQGALLVRPDGFVAWRDENASDDPEAELERALSGLLCLTTQTSRGVAQRYFRAGGASF